MCVVGFDSIEQWARRSGLVRGANVISYTLHSTFISTFQNFNIML